ncbi:CdaR family protein [uncultured Polaribacter sp.]|uniref:CdaR family protein n=1 Tax=uncultured Polaribacter sp. TaxID=174711 RepID=UPI0026148B8A|nr:CdaR family protein [uncultured Polaribacter sp.]
MKPKNKISKTFIGFLITSVVIWLLITLSKEYVVNVNFPLNYQGISNNKVLQSQAKNNLELIVKASGFKILKTRINSKTININAGAANKKNGTTHYILTKNQQGSLQKQLPTGLDLKEIVKDTFFLELGSLVTKKVPVKPDLKVNFHLGYDFVKPITLVPDSILVFGPENYINSLQTVTLQPLSLDDVKSDFENKVSIIKPKNVTNLKFSSQTVTIKGKVENFTEGTFEVPYKIINIPDGVSVSTLTKNCTVSFIISLKNFNKINKNSFEIVCDYAVAEKNNLNYLVPKLLNKSDLIKSYKIAPNKIDFLIEK